jgi:hypothetical protein
MDRFRFPFKLDTTHFSGYHRSVPLTTMSDVPRPAPGAHEPIAPIRHRNLGPVALGHLGRGGLDLMAAIRDLTAALGQVTP